MTFIKNSLKQIKNHLKDGQLLILESTTYPGTTKDIIFPTLIKKISSGKNLYYIPQNDKIQK